MNLFREVVTVLYSSNKPNSELDELKNVDERRDVKKVRVAVSKNNMCLLCPIIIVTNASSSSENSYAPCKSYDITCEIVHIISTRRICVSPQQ